MSLGSARISKREWYRLGGFANPNLWRRQQKGRGWQYYRSYNNH